MGDAVGEPGYESSRVLHRDVVAGVVSGVCVGLLETQAGAQSPGLSAIAQLRPQVGTPHVSGKPRRLIQQHAPQGALVIRLAGDSMSERGRHAKFSGTPFDRAAEIPVLAANLSFCDYDLRERLDASVDV